MVIMAFTCEYCKKVLSSKSSLIYHQKATKYCLTIQGLSSTQKVWVCNCGKEFNWKTNLTRHQNTCFVKPQLQTHVPAPAPVQDNVSRSEMMEVIDKLLVTLKDVANSHSTTINTHNENVLNLQPITNNYLETESIKHLTEQIVMEGRQPEIAVKVFDGYILIADKSRKKIKYKDSDGSVSTNSRKLVQEFYRAIQGKNRELAEKLYEEIQLSVNKYIEEDRASESEFTKLLITGTNLQERLNVIKNIAEGSLDEDSIRLADETIKYLVG